MTGNLTFRHSADNVRYGKFYHDMVKLTQMAQLPFISMILNRARRLLPRLGAVVAGGFLGGASRYLVTISLGETPHGSGIASAWSYFDWRLLVVNSIGVAVAVRLILGPLGLRPADDPVRLLWTTGVLGGLTTYSSLLFELGRMWQSSPSAAMIAGGLSLSLGLLAAYGASYGLRRRIWGFRAGL